MVKSEKHRQFNDAPKKSNASPEEKAADRKLYWKSEVSNVSPQDYAKTAAKSIKQICSITEKLFCNSTTKGSIGALSAPMLPLVVSLI